MKQDYLVFIQFTDEQGLRVTAKSRRQAREIVEAAIKNDEVDAFRCEINHVGEMYCTGEVEEAD